MSFSYLCIPSRSEGPTLVASVCGLVQGSTVGPCTDLQLLMKCSRERKKSSQTLGNEQE